MLQIRNIRKEYVTGDLRQVALDDVSLSLRDSEFVAVLGPSGSGKTTLLNIIGGLDRYDSGDLIINGVSTKRYKDRDWDSYRNHSIGFVFQSYNLIPHQTILSNVELALTISGVPQSERRRRAAEALEKVGLGDQLHKRPNQLSGGQMQRVAIARAMVNDPDILLADEPTGALDTKTSVQIMDLLKEVAKDRLVVMVTHNPELASEYATRIVDLKDGAIVGDTDPFVPETGAEAVHKNLGRAAMSFLTAMKLSFNNLRTKKGRTFLTAFAGSIGIIGIALILSLSNGARVYIRQVERETLSLYPLTIGSTGTDLVSLMSSMGSEDGGEAEGDVTEEQTLERMLSRVKYNDLASLRAWFESGESPVYDYSRAVEYTYDVTPLIYRITEDDPGYRQVNPGSTSSRSSRRSSMSALMSAFTIGSSTFSALPENGELYLDQYDVMAGRWPENDHELVLVLTDDSTVTDLVLYALGLKDADEMDEMMNSYANGESVGTESAAGAYAYEDFLDIGFKLVNAPDLYEYDAEYGVWLDRSDDADRMRALAEEGEDLVIVGVVKPAETTTAAMLSAGICYPYALERHVMELAADSEIVRQQLADPDTDVFSGNVFGVDEERMPDLSEMFSIDPNAMSRAFSFDTSALNIDPSALTPDLSNLLSGLQIDISPEQLTAIVRTLASGYLSYASADPATDYARLGEAVQQYLQSDEAAETLREAVQQILNESAAASAEAAPDTAAQIAQGGTSPADAAQAAVPEVTNEQIRQIFTALADGYDAYAADNGLPELSRFRDSFLEYLNTPEGRALVMSEVSGLIDTESIQSMLQEALAGTFSGVASQLMQALPAAFSFDASAFADAIQINFDAESLTELITSMMSSDSATYEGNLALLNYADPEEPYAISIYPLDFERKGLILEMLDGYNRRMRDAGEEDKVITYTDYVGTLMTSVTDIVDTISLILIAFVAISLVVSSIMIGIITYISVLERTKEIGILRAMGASKRNISQVFNAETVIIGLLAGVIGIVIALVLIIPINAFIHAYAGSYEINAVLPFWGAVFLIGVSVLLTLIGGLIPSRKASKMDPVAALRSE